MFSLFKNKVKVKKFKQKELEFIRDVYSYKEKSPGIVEVFEKYGVVDVKEVIDYHVSGHETRVYIGSMYFYYKNGFVIGVYDKLYLIKQCFESNKYYLYKTDSEQKECLIEVECSMNDEQVEKLNEDFNNLLLDCYRYWEEAKEKEEIKKLNKDKELLDQFMDSRLS